MKRLLAFLLCLALLLTLAACGNGGTNATEGTNDSTSATEGTAAAHTDKETDSTKNIEGNTPPTNGNDKENTAPTTGDTTQPADTTQPTVGTDITEPTVGTDTTKPTVGTEATESTVGTHATEPTHPHEYADKVTAPTCTEDGYTTHICACGDRYVDSQVAAAGHKFGEWKTTKKATATSTGEEARKCNHCGASETRVIGKLIENHTHSYTEMITKAATCSAEGIKTYTCSCGDSYTEQIAKRSHNYNSEVTAPTCTDRGYTSYTCTDCGFSYVNAHVPAAGHSFAEVVTKPTCTGEGHTTHACTRCGYSYTDTVVNALGHQYIFVSCESNGVCARCGAEGEYFAHNWEYQEGTCQNCGISICDYAGHSFGSDVQCQFKWCQAYDEAVTSKIDSIFAEILTDDMSEFEIVKAFHDYLCIHTEYDWDTAQKTNEDKKSYTARGPCSMAKQSATGLPKLLSCYVILPRFPVKEFPADCWITHGIKCG